MKNKRKIYEEGLAKFRARLLEDGFVKVNMDYRLETPAGLLSIYLDEVIPPDFRAKSVVLSLFCRIHGCTNLKLAEDAGFGLYSHKNNLHIYFSEDFLTAYENHYLNIMYALGCKVKE